MQTFTKQPAIFISHGAPWDVQNKDHVTHKFLRQLGNNLVKPSAIIIISGHDESEGSHFIVSSNPYPHIVHDYHPPFSFEYNTIGDPKLAETVQKLLNASGLECRADVHRGMDHGAWTILSSMFPAGDIPVVTLSMASDYDAEKHIQMGSALQPIRNENILIIGSGQTTHNLYYLMQTYRSSVSSIPEWSSGFANWLSGLAISPSQQRNKELAQWEQHPFARMAHPTPDHFVPFLVVAGASIGNATVKNEVYTYAMAAHCYIFN
jgi:aromatic ring-opening dioxygenase catalytic subunit (LigB family)